MAIIGTCHVESVAGSGVASVIATCQRVEEPRGIRHRKWSRIVAIIVVCQGVMEPRGIRRKKWSRVVTVTAACHGVMEPRGIHCRRWNRIVAVAVACQGVQVHWSEFDWGVWRREAASYPSERSLEFGSRRSSESFFS